MSSKVYLTISKCSSILLTDLSMNPAPNFFLKGKRIWYLYPFNFKTTLADGMTDTCMSWAGIFFFGVIACTRIYGYHAPWFDTSLELLLYSQCSFILWLALRNRLWTRDRMIQCHMNTPANCLLCNSMESINHLFSDCSYFDLIRRACPIKFSEDRNQCRNGNIFNANCW